MYIHFPRTFFYFKRRINFLIVLSIFLISVSNAFAQKEKGFKLHTIVIDAGHGGKDPGAVCKSGKKVNGKEKDITLILAKQVGDYIKKYYKDIKVIYTRETDEFIELHNRASIANKNKADLFISIHVNSSKKSDPYGAETYVMGIHKTQGNLEVAMIENSVVLKEQNYDKEYEGVDPNSQEAYIIFNMLQNAYIEQSLNFASKIQSQFKTNLKRFDRGVKQAVFFVLWKTVMPSVLIEVGFISNKEESEYLLSKSGQDQLAYGIFNGIRMYKNEQEGIKDDGLKIERPEFSTEKKNKETKENPTESTSGNNESVKENRIETKTDEIKSNETAVSSNVKEEGIVFKIQITNSSVKIPLSSSVFKGLSVEEIIVEGVFKYTVCTSRNFKEIENLQKLIRADFPDSFIIAFNNGKKIPISDAIKEIKN